MRTYRRFRRKGKSRSILVAGVQGLVGALLPPLEFEKNSKKKFLLRMCTAAETTMIRMILGLVGCLAGPLSAVGSGRERERPKKRHSFRTHGCKKFA